MEIIKIRQHPRTQRILRHSTLMLIFSLLILLTPPTTMATGGFRLCGLKLTMTLNAICKNQLCGGYIMSKRNNNEENEKNSEEFEFNLHDSEETTERRKKRFYPYGAFAPVKKSGIATECCSKRCTLGYMKTYCCSNSVRFGE
uniref:Insulin-like domain-containing protein n=1 Tax=Meloidogyne incognita TaxID=6306 RepID=A0A914NG50_MELIC